MGIEFFFAAVILLGCFAIFDLIVGVSNDAVNFLNSSIGSRVAPRYVIMIIASVGILVGVTFSSGMMEVARKGIFHPGLFTMPELLVMFLAVMLTDIILLDLFNTFGLPTSTTVSIVFELLGAAVAVSVAKIVYSGSDLSALAAYINTSKALVIISGILLSIAVAFICGAVAQFLSRLLFTFDYAKRMKRYGALWGGMALTSITYFILVKGAGGTSFIGPEKTQWIMSHAPLILLGIFPVTVVILHALHLLRINVFKPIVLAGTFALAMAFAANDLVNFIGVPMAGYHAYLAAAASDSPLTITMGALAQKVPAETHLLLGAGLIMVLTLWLSRKARTVTETELSLGRQDEGVERFESSHASRAIVSLMRTFFDLVRWAVPGPLRAWLRDRLDTEHYRVDIDDGSQPRFDLLRASVNLMVASAVISFATSQKLPLSTTYVTFMVAMGTSFADRSWGRDSAVYRVSGVLAVVSGWFLTALLAFTISGIFAAIIFHAQAYGVVLLLAAGTLIIMKNHRTHISRNRSAESEKIFNLKKVSSISDTLYTTFEHMAYLLREIRVSLDSTLEALFLQNGYSLDAEKAKTRKFQDWTNIIIANIFKTLRLMQKGEMAGSYKYGQTIRRLQKLVDGHRDIVMRSHFHVKNHHKGLLDVQIQEIRQVKHLLNSVLSEVEMVISRRRIADVHKIVELNDRLRQLAGRYHEEQLARIRTGASKTRLSILYYSIVGNAMMLSKQNVRLLEIFRECFSGVTEVPEFDLD